MGNIGDMGEIGDRRDLGATGGAGHARVAGAWSDVGAGAGDSAGAGGGILVLRRGGATWGVAHGDVRALGRGAAGDFRVTVAAGELAADEILGVARLAAPPRPAGTVLRRFWPEAARGLAVHGALPLVLIDPAAPPAALRAESLTNFANGDRHDGN